VFFFFFIWSSERIENFFFFLADCPEESSLGRVFTVIGGPPFLEKKFPPAHPYRVSSVTRGEFSFFLKEVPWVLLGFTLPERPKVPSPLPSTQGISFFVPLSSMLDVPPAPFLKKYSPYLSKDFSTPTFSLPPKLEDLSRSSRPPLSPPSRVQRDFLRRN